MSRRGRFAAGCVPVRLATEVGLQIALLTVHLVCTTVRTFFHDLDYAPAADRLGAHGLAHTAWRAYAGSGKAGMTAATETGLLTLFAVALAWFGQRWQRPEMNRLVYPLMIVIGYRILMRDFSLGHTLALFVSLLLYGGALVLLPRISAKGARTAG